AGDVGIAGTDTVPEPIVGAPPDLVDAATAEPYEGVLVRVEGVTVATAADNFGEWTVGAGPPVDDLFFAMGDWPKPNPGDTFTSITAPLHYSFENYKLVPRTAADLVP